MNDHRLSSREIKVFFSIYIFVVRVTQIGFILSAVNINTIVKYHR